MPGISEMTPKERAEAIRNTYNSQKTIEDKLWFVVELTAQQNARLQDLTSGMKEEDILSVEESDEIDAVTHDMFVELLGDCSRDSIMNAYRRLALMGSNIAMEAGIEYNKVLNDLKHADELKTEEEKKKDPTITGDPKKDQYFYENKAAYILSSSKNRVDYLATAFNTLAGVGGISGYLNDEDINAKMWNAVKYNKSMTVEKYHELIGDTEEETKAYCKQFECKPTDRIFDIFKKQIKKNGGKTKDKDVIAEIRKDYIFSMGAYFEKNGVKRMSEEGRSQRDKLTLSDRKLFLAGQYIFYKTKSVTKYEGIKDVKATEIEISINKGDNPKRAESKEEEKQIEDDIKAFESWRDNQSASLVDDYSKKHAVKDRDAIINNVHSGKSMNFKNKDSFARLKHDIIANANIPFISGAIFELEATGTLGRSKNSNEYEKMLKDFKLYEKELKKNNSIKAIEARSEAAKSCLDYIKKGMSSVRRNPDGRKRFDIALYMMAEMVSPSLFTKVVEEINISRGTKPGKSDYLDANKIIESRKDPNSEIRKIRQAQREREDELQRTTEKNTTKINPGDEKKIEKVEALFGMHPSQSKLFAKFVTAKVDGREMRLDKIDYKMIPIGPYKDDIQLSNKDFAAIAYAGSLTVEAASLDKNDPELTLDEKIKQNGHMHTSSLLFSKFDKKSLKHAGYIEYGRNMALEAMKAYEIGDKEKLAYIITSGVKVFGTAAKNAEVVDDSFVINYEMGERLVNMLVRDPELLKIASQQGFRKEDYYDLRTAQLGSEIICNYKNAFTKLDDPSAYDLSSSQRIDLVTDIVLKQSLDWCMNTEKNMNKKTVENQPRFLESLKNPQNMETFKKQVKQLVKSSKIYRDSPKLLMEKMKSKDFLVKIQNVANKEIEKHNVANKKALNRKASATKANPSVKAPK